MLILLSPAKTLDFESQVPDLQTTRPRFISQSSELVELLRQYDTPQLAKLMGISDSLASLNVERYAKWSKKFTKTNSRPAIFAFRGDSYIGLDADTLSAKDLAYTQDHLRILSGLYGLLRPLDLIQPYRLEMSTRLVNPAGNNLYRFWADQLTDAINKDLKDKNEIVVNLASTDYYKAVDLRKLNAEVISPTFMDRQGDAYKVVGLFAKKARGMMARWIIDKRPKTRFELQDFKDDGYRFAPEASGAKELVFLREEQ